MEREKSREIKEHLPQAENATHSTALLPTLLVTTVAVETSHTRTVLSQDPLARMFASVGLNARVVTDDVASKLASMVPVSLFQIFMVVS